MPIKDQKANKGERFSTQKVQPLFKQDDGYPIFSLNHIDQNYSFITCNGREKKDLIISIQKRVKLTWKKIKSLGRHGLGFEKIDKSSIKVGVPPIITEDTVILAFRFSKLKPMIGFRDGNVFHIIWIDRKFKVYKH